MLIEAPISSSTGSCFDLISVPTLIAVLKPRCTSNCTTMEPPQTHEGTDVNVSPNERLRSSSTSSSSSIRSSEFEDPIQLDSLDPGRISSKDHDKSEQGTRQQDGESALQSPLVQTMERPPDGSSGYGIPSHVFSREKSGPPMDWRSVSNESLFSIRMGDTSFTWEQYNSWLEQSGELPSTPEASSPPMHDDSHSPIGSSTGHIANHGPSKVVESKTSDGRRARPSMGDEQATPVSTRSNASGVSFSFPVLEGGLERGGSTVKPGLSLVLEKPEPQTKPSSDANEAHSPAPQATSAFTCSWFGSCVSYFSCCAKTYGKGCH